MFTQILYTQWKWTRAALGMFVVLSFVIPVALWRLNGPDSGSVPAISLMQAFDQTGAFLAVIALLGGFVLAVVPWTVDAQAKHVYPLSLPVPWPRYVVMRFGAGAVSLGLPAIALWLGCLVTLAFVDVPATLHTYPGTVAARFLLASLVAYGITFALQYLAGRRAVLLLLGILVAVLVAGTALELLGLSAVNQSVVRVLFEWPGPLSVFTADWSLIDV
jgi:hypothetical protein